MHGLTELPENYSWLMDEPGPKLIVEARKWFGLKEISGARNNPWIMRWAGYLGGWVAGYYSKDSIAWCGLFIGYIVAKSRKPTNAKLLSARSWAKWGTVRKGPPKLGDILVFWREKPTSWKGHVGLYVAEDKDAYHVLGGNQGDSVSIIRISKNRLVTARYFYKTREPENVRRVFMTANGELSKNEA